MMFLYIEYDLETIARLMVSNMSPEWIAILKEEQNAIIDQFWGCG